MVRIKKILSLFTVGAVLLAGVAGCGEANVQNSSSVATASEATTQMVEQETKKELQPVTLRWILPKIQTQNENGPVFDAANKTIAEKIKATVKFDFFEWADFNNKISLLLAAEEEADIFFTSNWVNNYYQNVAKGGLADITDMLDTAAPNLKAKFSDAIWDAVRVKGKIYAVPNQAIFVRKCGLEFRKDLIEKYSFDYNSVKKLQDIEPFLKTLKEKEPTVIPIENNKGPSNTPVLFDSAKNILGWDTFVSMKIPGAGRNFGDLKVFNQFETQEFKDFLKLVRDWYKKGYIQRDAATLADGSANRQSAKVAVVSAPAVYPGAEQVYLSQSGGTPYVLNSTMDGDAAMQTGSIAANLNAVCRTSRNPERALMLLELVNSDKELFNLLCWGIEGTNYTKHPDGTIEQIKNGKYEGIYNFFLGDMFQTYITTGQPIDMYDQMKKINDTGKASVFLGFVFDPEPVKSQIAQCTSVADQYLPGLATGYLDPDKSYQEFIDKLKNAGSDQIIEEMQKQVDAWANTGK